MAGGIDKKKEEAPGPEGGAGGHSEESSGYDSETDALEKVRQMEEQAKTAQEARDKQLAELQQKRDKKRLEETAKKILRATKTAADALADSPGGADDEGPPQIKNNDKLSIFVFKVQGEPHVSPTKVHALPMYQTPKQHPAQDLRNAEANNMPVKVVIIEKDKTYQVYDETDGK